MRKFGVWILALAIATSVGCRSFGVMASKQIEVEPADLAVVDAATAGAKLSRMVQFKTNASPFMHIEKPSISSTS